MNPFQGVFIIVKIINMKVKIILAISLVIIIVAGVFVYRKYQKSLGPAVNKPPGDIAQIIDQTPKEDQNTSGFPLKLPKGFSIEVFAKNLSGARVIKLMPNAMWVSRTSAGIITKLEISNGKVSSQTDVYKNLRGPHGIAFDPQDSNIIYIAEEHQITKRAITGGAVTKIADLPTQGGGHSTRTIGFGPDNRLYVSIGSSCNVCRESDSRRAAIYTMNKDGSDFKSFAVGLRNTVFFTWSPIDGRMWGTDMGRDLLGDDIPPDEINILQEGNFGWPNCYGKNVHDTNFDKNTYIRNPCMEPFEKPAFVELQAHSAPLGLGFIPEEGWPEDLWYDLIVAFHGSWNRSVPTGYKLVRIKLDSKGNYQGTEDFITGWLQGNGALGRPVDVLIQPGGTMYVSDDKAGLVYKIYKTK